MIFYKQKYSFYLIASLFLLGCQSSGYKWFSGSFEEAKIAAGSKLILLDFYTNFWVGCFRLDADTFSDPNVVSFSDNNFISLKFIANEKNGNNYFK